MATRNLLLTGSTGFLGLYLAKRFLEDDAITLIVLVRPKDKDSARRRIERLLKDRLNEKEFAGIQDRFQVVEGNITHPNLGLTKKQGDELSRKVTTIIHSAALAEFNIPYEKIKPVNVDGTRNVLEFAQRCFRNGSLESVAHISTIAVSGSYRGVFYEDCLDVGQ